VTNITVSIPDEVYRAARVRAAERGSSVSALVAEYLCSLSEHKAEFARLEDQQRRIQSEIDRFSVGACVDRDVAHSRTVR
jgi:plasmid stability protein